MFPLPSPTEPGNRLIQSTILSKHCSIQEESPDAKIEAVEIETQRSWVPCQVWSKCDLSELGLIWPSAFLQREGVGLNCYAFSLVHSAFLKFLSTCCTILIGCPHWMGCSVKKSKIPCLCHSRAFSLLGKKWKVMVMVIVFKCTLSLSECCSHIESKSSTFDCTTIVEWVMISCVVQ